MEKVLNLMRMKKSISKKKNSFNKKSNSNQNVIVSEIRKFKTVNLKKMSIIDEKAEFGNENNKNKV